MAPEEENRQPDGPQDGPGHNRFLRARRSRSIAIALSLAGFAVMFYLITLVKMGPAVFNRPL